MKKAKGLKTKGLNGSFDRDAYQRRLRLLREIVSGENQVDFAKRLGIPLKRWNNYERGYPVPRETAWLIMDKFEGISIEWLWFGLHGNLSPHYLKKIEQAQAFEDDQIEAERAKSAAERKLREIADQRKKVIHPDRKR